MFFVSPDDDNSNPGTRTSPKLTIQSAIDAANSARLNGDVYIAQGTYSESLTLGDGVSLYGGFDPEEWTRSEDATLTTIDGNQRAIYGNETNDLTIEGLTINADDGDASSLSSIGIGLESCTGLIITNNLIHAGLGYNGADGVHGTDGPDGDDGGIGTADTPGQGGQYGGQAEGDGGYRDIPLVHSATDGQPGEGLYGSAGGLKSPPDPWLPFVYGQAGPGGNGGVGEDGSDGDGAAHLGELVNGSYLTADGTNGTTGLAGCGGGGGGGGINTTVVLSSPGGGGGAGAAVPR